MDARAILSSNKIFIDSQILTHMYIFGDILSVSAEVHTRVLYAELCGGSKF